MTIDEILHSVSDFYNYIEKQNPSIETLIAVAVLFLILSLIAFRESMTWFLKIDRLRSELRENKKLLEKISTELEELKSKSSLKL